MNDRIGQQFGSYRLIHLLGQGSFAEVYLGEHVYLKTQAAIKVLQARLASDDEDSFLTEAQTVANLKHPNIVRILESGVQGNAPFLIMEYAPHGTLRQCYPAGTCLPFATVLSYVKQVSDALQYTHNQKLIHRDVKPENMLLGKDNKVLLSDFGIALISQSSRSQSMQEIVGTVAYMAPEQLKGKPYPASDQYALGVVVYEWLSGECPFHGSFTEIASQHVFVLPPPLHEKVPEISPAVEEVVQIALAKDPKLRFANMQAFANALEQASKSEQLPFEARTFFMPNLSSLLPEQADNITQPFSEEHSAQTLPNDPPQPLPILSVQKRLSPHPLPSVTRAILLIALALLIVTSGIGLIYYTAMLHPRQLQAQGTTTAQTMLTAHAQAVAQAHIHATETAQINTNAEATADAFAKAEAIVTATARHDLYIQATNGSPVIDDSLLYSNGNHWVEGTSSTGQSCTFTGEAYHVIDPQLNSLYPCFANATNFSNFAFQVQMTILKGDIGGLVFRADNAHANYCLFGLASDGTYQFYCYVNSTYTLYLSSASAVGYQSPQPNLLTVIARGSNIFLYVNKQYVGSVRESLLSSGEIGMFVEANTQPTDVAFSHAQVWNL